MFTLDRIHKALEKVRTGADFPNYVRELKALGVSHYDNFVSDGKTIYYGTDNSILQGKEKYPSMPVENEGSKEKLLHALQIHQAGQTDYLTFCRQSAEAGVEKWCVKVQEMEVIYSDKTGIVLVSEQIP